MVFVALLVSLLNDEGTVVVDDSQSTCAPLAVIGVDMAVDRSVGLM